MRGSRRQQDGGAPRRGVHPGVLGLPVLMALAWIFAGEVRPAAAGHYVDEGSSGCYACHTLDDTEGDSNSSFINRSSRTMLEMRSANGGTTPDQFGCTYCHNIGTRTQMKAVLTHFTGKASMHPVGKNFVTGADTNREYLSSWATAFQNELDCVDCHDVNGMGDGRDDPLTDPLDESADGDPATTDPASPRYPEHGRPAYAWNPYMLRNLTAADAYDPLCRTCHGNSAPPTKGPSDAEHNLQLTATSPHTDGNAGAGGSGPIAESDGTLLRTTAAGGNDQCRKCHDSHFSSRQRLFNDGHELVGGTANPETPIDVSNCTTDCHFPGDQYDNFETHGHGKATAISGGTLNFNCTNCHSVNAVHDSTFPVGDPRAAKMLSATPDPNISVYGKSLESVCTTCHNALSAHKGTVGCLDCHDEHAEGSGSTSNIYMVPQQLPNRTSGGREAVVFEHATTGDYDYFIDDNTAPHVAGAGVCDNGICHAGQTSSNGTPVSPLSGLMTGTNHTGGSQSVLSNCASCHKHEDTTGSWDGSGICTNCHGQPPVSLATQFGDYSTFFENKTPHNRHASPRTNPTQPNVVGYAYSCQMCHNQWTNSITHDTGEETYGYTYASIWFDRTFNPQTTDFASSPATSPYLGDPAATVNYDEATATCTNIYCHSDGSNGNAVGTARWMTGQQTPDYAAVNLACDACHGDGNGDGVGRSYPNDAQGNHARHVITAGAGCQNCHGSTTADGTTILLANGLHVNRVKNVDQGGVYPPASTYSVSFGWTDATKTCTNVSCHSGQTFNAADIQWTSAGGSCTVCHNNGTNDGALANAWPIQGEHQIHAGAQPAAQGYACTRCHPDNGDGTHETLDKAAAVTFDGNFVAGGTFDNDGFNNVLGSPEDGDNNLCSATYCHGGDPTWWADWDSNGAVNGDGVVRDAGGGSQTLGCDSCHGTAGLGTGRPNSPATGGRHTGTAHLATACTVCHLNTNANRALHAQGPAQTAPLRADAAMAAAVDTAPYWRQWAAAGAPDQGFAWTGGTCGDMTTGCHPAASWGQVAGCALCHGVRPAGAGLTGQSWPDGAAPAWPDANPAPPARASYYFDDSAGSATTHNNHVLTVGQYLGYGDYASTMYTQPQQDAICAFCHEAVPGGASHRVNGATLPDLANRVTVYLDTDDTGATNDVFRKFTLGAAAVADDLTAANGDQAYNYATRSCANLVCHNRQATPAGANNWDVPGTQNCTICHPDGAGTGAHATHTAAAQKAYACNECHVSNGTFPVPTLPAEMRHLNGDVQMSFANAGSLEVTRGGASAGFYDKNDAAANNNTFQPATDHVFAYRDGNYAKDCLNVYCHGGDNQPAWAGSDPTPLWGDPTTGNCGTCHDTDLADTSAATRLAVNQHPTHAAAAYGPRAACGDCHAGSAPATATHVNGSISFEDGAQVLRGAIGADATVTSCNACHAGSAATAKSFWAPASGQWLATGGYCEHCHDATPATVNTAAGTGGANAVAADRTQYFTSGGHGTAGVWNGANYPTLHDQPGPAYACTICHTTTSGHIDGTLGTTDRLQTAATDGASYTTASSEFCLDCHGTGAHLLGNAVAKASVHSGGVNSSYNTSGSAPSAFPAYGEAPTYLVNKGYQCSACHDPHGTGKLAMVLDAIDGGLGAGPVPIAGLQSSDTSFLDLDPSAAAGDGVCDACHRVTGDTAAHPDTTPPGEGPSGNHYQGGAGASCMGCHSHDESFRGSCARCHGNESTGQIWPDGIGGNNSGRTAANAYADTETGSHAEHIALLVDKEGFSASVDDQIAMCAYCHPNPGGIGHEANTTGTVDRVDLINDGTPANAGAYKRIDSVSDLAGTADSAHVVGSYSPATRTCAGIDCHYEKPTPVAPAQAAYPNGWDDGDANTPTCTTCHTDGLATYAPGDLPNAHARHVDEYADGGYNFGCSQCHPAWATTQHLNGVIELSFGSTLGEPGSSPATQSGSDFAVKYGQTGGGFPYATCNALYCHGADTTAFPLTGNGGTDTTPTWDTASTGACGTCHGRTPAAPPRSNAHVIHAGNTAQVPAGYSLGCNLCHVQTSADGTTITNPVNHVDYQADVSFDGGDARLHTGATPSTYYGDAAVGGLGTYGACGNTYCHSPGTDRTKPFTVAANTPVSWNATATCTDCHGVPPGYGDGTLVEGAPKANKHGDHAAQGYTECRTCHAGTAANNGAIASPGGFGVHVNGSYEASPYAPNGALNSFAYAAGTCSATNCHGGNSVAWSAPGPITCDVCHGESAGTPVDGDVNNFSMRDWTQSKIDSAGAVDEYGTAGHGKAGVARTCDHCHDSGVAHDTTAPLPNSLQGANPFRLDAGFTCSNTTAGCHANPPASQVVSHTRANMVAAGYAPQVNSWSFSPDCLSCHDPHGDQATGQSAGNLAMVQRELYESPFGIPAGPPPAVPTEQTDLAFTGTTGVGSASYAWTTTATPNYSGVCQECHETADVDFTSFKDGVSASAAPHPDAGGNPGACSTCHPHSEAFRPPGCSDCHGNTATGAYWPDDSTAHLANDAGRHQRHMEEIAAILGFALPGTDAQQKQACEYCHAAVANDDDHGSTATLPAEVFATTVATVPRRFAKRLWDAGADGDAGYAAAGGGTCATTDCHNNKTTTNAAPNDFSWYGNPPPGNGAACLMCHVDVTAAGDSSHTAHLTTPTLAAGGAIACSFCHEASTDWAGGTPPALGHLNGVFAVGGSVSFTYSGYSYPTVKGSCGTNICHNDGKNAAAYSGGAGSYAWGTPIGVVGSCAECHRASPVTQSHAAHLSTTTQAAGGALGCASCHGAGADTAVTHANFAVNLGGVSFTYSGGTNVNESPRVDNGSCGINLCHNDGKNNTPYNNGQPTYAWDTGIGGPNSCSECHRPSPITQSHGAHLSTATRAGGGLIVCASCHGAGVETGAAHANATVTFGGVSFTYGGGALVGDGSDAGSCGTNLCHNDGKNQQPYNGTGAPTYAWGTPLGGGTNTCTDCHLDLMATGSHTAHRTTTTQAAGGLIVCASCHGAAPHAADAHANATVTFGGVSFAYSGGAVVGDGSDAGSCGTNACHTRGFTVVATLQPPYNGGAGAYSWGTGIGAVDSCTECHGSGANDANATEAHPEHMGAAATFGITTIACGSCHAAATVATHANQSVTIAGPAYTGGTAVSDTSFGTCNQNACHNDGAGGVPLNSAYQWNQTYANCTLCHADVPATGNHTDHLTAAYGPAFGTDCGACHVANANNTTMAGRPKHINGTVEFANVVTTTSPDAVLGLTAPAGAPSAASTDRCNSCHSTASVTLDGVGTVVGTVLAKTNWDAGAYALPCLTCHNPTDAATDNAAGTVGPANPAAPDMLGNDSASLTTGYGAEVRGHGRAAAFQDADGNITNPGAGRPCADCHDTAADHLNGTNDSAYAGLRLLGTINGQATGSVTGVCNACHTPGGGSRATSFVSPHGNSDYLANPQHDPAAENFAYRCEACHEPHGMTNDPVPPVDYANIYMVRPQIGVGSGYTSVPGGADQTTTPARFQRLAGAESFDDNASQTDNVCVTCHTNGARPGGVSALRNSDGNHSEVAGFFTGNEQGKTCMNCHTHEYDNNTATLDGFMPLRCDECHSYPGLTGGTPDHTLSATHNIHVNDQANGGYGFPCATCHYNYNHNQSNYVAGSGWNNATIALNANVRFNPAWNDGTDLTYGGAGRDADVGTTGLGVDGGTCAGLYCHGNDSGGTNSQADWAGAAEQPAWTAADPPRLACNSCHDDPPGSGAHLLHVVDNDGGDRTDCALCHGAVAGYGAPANTTTDPANHVNLATEVTSVTYTGQTTAIPPDGYCTAACHASAAGDGRWNDTALNCNACHHYKTGDAVGEHAKHTNGAALVMACAACHTAFVDGEVAGPALTHPSNDLVGDGNNITDRAGALESETSVSDAGYNGGTSTFVDGADTCSNAWCHDPSGIAKTADWDLGTTIADCTFCHDAVPATGSHGQHFAAQGTYGLAAFAGNACGACHLTVAAGNYDHIAENGANGNVKFNGSVITNQYTAPAVLPAGATGWGSCGTNGCHEDGLGGAPAAYTWGTAVAEPSCALCHAQKPATGAHNTHVGTTAAWGPHGVAGTNDCSECHEATTNTPTFTMAGETRHLNGSVTFLNRAVPATPFEVANGQIGAVANDPVDSCNNCHGGATSANAVAGAKDGWAGATRLACGSCHGQNAQAWSTAAGGGAQAPDIMGDAATYGSDVTGHSRAAGNYASGNNPANKACAICHTTTSAHIDGANGTGFADHRIQATINSQAVADFEGACNACHQNGGTDAGTQVSRHGNSNAGGYTPIEGAFTVNCLVCHEPHGLVNGGGSVNWSMFRYALTTPAGPRNVQLTARTGANSFDELTGDTVNADQYDDACATCHIDGVGATTMVRHTTAPAGGGIHEGTAFTGDERGKNCIACHTHTYDGLPATADGFMPEQCDSCHTYPGLANTSAEHTLSGVHNVHVNANNAAVPGYNFDCQTCHFGYNHNQSGFLDGGVWNNATIAPNVNIRFDTADNPTNQTDYPRYNSQNATTASTAGIGGTGTCAGLYCHGNNQTLQSDWAGTTETPSWAVADPPVRLACDACHNDPPASGAHALHVVDNGATNRTDCDLCHTNVGAIDAATPVVPAHVNGTTVVVNVGYGSETTAIPPDGTCTSACHESIAADGRWNDTALDCDACHYYNVAGNPSAANNTAGSTYRTISETSHDGHFAATGRTWSCNDCHPNNAADVSPLTHVTPGAGADSAVIQGRAVPTQAEATISTTQTPQWWDAPGDWTGNVTKTCSNRCHDPSSGVKISSAWGTTNVAGCEFCHNSATAPATGGHAAHIGATATYGLTIACVSCHPNQAGNDGHMTGTVELANIAGATPYAGALTPPWNATFGACTTSTCHNDGDGVTAVPTPVWGNASASACGTCHAQTPATGSHNTHLAATAYGPHPAGSTNCGECHEAQANNTSMTTETRHVNGTVTFLNRAVPASPYEVASGQIGAAANDAVDTCNSCHGGPAGANAASGAKDSWAAAPRLACGTCHGTYALARQNADGTGTTAPNAVQYYATANGGHGAVAPVQSCEACHDEAGAHIDSTANNEDRIVQANITTFCQYCHDSNGADDNVAGQSVVEVAATRASTHGNTSPGYNPTQWAKETNFTQACLDCHNPHGTANITMVNTTINAQSVTFTADTQWDTVGSTTDVCQVCHTATEHNGDGPSGQHQADYRGTNQCSGCHAHEFDGNEATVDGFMPAACDACHSFPGLGNLSDEHALSPIHNIHVDPQASGGYAIACTRCHFGYEATHNASGFADGGVWDNAAIAPNVRIQFDPALNPTNQTDYPRYNSLSATPPAATVGINGAGVCAGLYCHGNNQTLQADWAGSAEQPAWHPTNNPARFACSACHADPPASGAHGLHADAADEADRTDCVLCHATAGGYGASANATTDPANHVNGTTTVGYAYGAGTAVDGFCAGACHASTAAGGRWNAASLACDACHYYNVAGNPSAATNTGGSTFRPISETSHDGHFAATGRAFACTDCHTDNTTDGSPLGHVTPGAGNDAAVLTGRAVPTQSEATISTTATPQWWDAAGDWTGTATKTCSNRCHDPSSGVKISSAWGTTNAAGCEFCHNSATAPATGSHAAHIGATATYGLTIACVSCHPNQAGNDGHMTGTVELANIAGATPYAGALTPPWNATFGACTTTTCHSAGDGATAVPTPVWGNAAATTCGTCHATPPATGRHVKHDDNDAWVADDCGACHTANANKTSMTGQPAHIDGSVNVGGTGTVTYLGGGDCTNACHNVIPASAGDWLDANPLACWDCHGGTWISDAPITGLHQATTALAHDDAFGPGDAYSCTGCHAAAGPSAAHLTGPNGALPQDSTQAAYSFNAANIPAGGYVNTGHPADTTCQATCHSDYRLGDTGGLWRRKWLGVEDAVPLDTNVPGDLVCRNCHGDITNGWNWNEANASTTDHTDPYADGTQTHDAMGIPGEHPDCQICHGWGDGAYNRTWGGTPGHGDGSITMNGPDDTPGPGAGAKYDDATGGCAAACHIPGYVLETNSGWPANYGDFGAGNCENCHDPDGPGPNVMGDGADPIGQGTPPKPYDDGTWGFNVNGHGANGSAQYTPKDGLGAPYLSGDAACTDCHTVNPATHRNGNLESVEAEQNAAIANPAHLNAGYISGSSSPEYSVQLTFDNQCTNQCHGAIGHRHSKDAVPAAGVVRFGDKLSKVNGEAIAGIPIDMNLSSNAPDAPANGTTQFDYAVCISCHNPHGTNVVEPEKSTNRMIRFEFQNTDTLCRKCH